MIKQVLLLLFAASAIPATAEAAEFDAMVKQLPGDANVVMAIDAKKMLASTIAKARGWDSKVRDGRHPIYLPPEVDSVVISAKVDPNRDFTKSWQAGLASLSESLSMSQLARAEGGQIDSFDGMDAAWMPTDCYYMRFNPQLIAIRHPADRQASARWAKQQSAGISSSLSVYLRGGIKRVERGPQIVLALDASNIAQPFRARQRLEQSEIVKKHRLKVQEVLDTFLSLKGVILEITLTDKANAKLSMDFGQQVPFSRSAGKAFFLAGLSQFHAELPGMDSWIASVSGSSVVLEGELEDDALRRVLSILEFPTNANTYSEQSSGADQASGDVDPKAQASLAYFKSVNTLVEDLKRHSKESSRDSYFQELYADKIDHLPLLNVDEALLDFGEKTAQTLRVMSTSRTKSNINAGVRGANSLADSSYYGYGGRQIGFGSSTHAIKNQELGGALITRTDGYKLIADATAQMRRMLTEKYQVQF